MDGKMDRQFQKLYVPFGDKKINVKTFFPYFGYIPLKVMLMHCVINDLNLIIFTFTLVRVNKLPKYGLNQYLLSCWVNTNCLRKQIYPSIVDWFIYWFISIFSFTFENRDIQVANIISRHLWVKEQKLCYKI